MKKLTGSIVIVVSLLFCLVAFNMSQQASAPVLDPVELPAPTASSVKAVPVTGKCKLIQVGR